MQRSADPLHGVTLAQIVTELQAEYGWEELARRVPVRCFEHQPSVPSSLKFLRRTPWARERVEAEYVRLREHEALNPLIEAARQGEPLALSGVSETKLHAALGWMLRHLDQNAEQLERYFLPTLAAIGDVNFWPEAEPMPLINLAVERAVPGAEGYRPDVIHGLLERGANVNDPRFWPPLLHAADALGLAYRRGVPPRTDILDLLLRAGADPALADPRGNTALSIAEAYGLKAALPKLRAAK